MIWKKFLTVVIVCSPFSLNVLAGELFTESERPLLIFHSEPTQPKVGERVSLFLQVDSNLAKNETVLEATLDGVPVKLVNTASQLWAASFKPFSEIKDHSMIVNIFVRDLNESNRIRSAASAVQKEINLLNSAIAAEGDAVRKAALTAERDQKQSYKDELEASLEKLKVFLKSENYSFSIASDPNNINYPTLLSVSPNAVPLNKRIHVILTGAHFPATPHVKIGGQNASIVSATDGSIKILAPNFSSSGSKDIEIDFPAAAGEPKKNAVLTGAFFVADSPVLKNLRPVAVTTGYVRAVWPITAPVQIDASKSYDENGDAFLFDYLFTKVPAGSSFSGSTLPNTATPSFTPDKVGVYTLRCKIIETNTEERLSSFPSTVTIEVK